MGKPTVRPTAQEKAFIKHEALARNTRAEAAGRKRRYGVENISAHFSELDLHEQGVAGELMTAKALNLYPSGLFNPYESDDDLGGIQVRCRTEHWHELYLWPDDPKDAYYVLITGTIDTYFRVHGYIHGEEAKQEKYWTRANKVFPKVDAYVIPTADLTEFDFDEMVR